MSIFAAGHFWLLIGLVLGLGVLQFLRRGRKFAFFGVAALVAVYFLGGGGQYLLVAGQAKQLVQEGQELHVEPADPWMSHWLIAVADGQGFQFRRYRISDQGFASPLWYNRWNDESVLVRTLEDPITHYFYYHRFRHPVVRIKVTGSLTRLEIQELADQSPPQPGATFFYERDREAGLKTYQAIRFH